MSKDYKYTTISCEKEAAHALAEYCRDRGIKRSYACARAIEVYLGGANNDSHR